MGNSYIGKLAKSRGWTEKQRENAGKSWTKYRREKSSKRMVDNNPRHQNGINIKIEKTCLKKYGVKNIFYKTDKIKQAVLQKFGVSNVSKLQSVKDKISGAFTAKRKEEYTDRIKKHAITQTGAFSKDAIKRRINTYCERLARGDYHISNCFMTGYFVKKNGETEWYDSSLELKRMEELEDGNYTWTKKHKIRIPYINNKGRETFYIPDFLIDNMIIEEIKGWNRPNTILKVAAALKYCLENNLKYHFKLGVKLDLIPELSLL